MYKELMQDNPYSEPSKFIIRDNGDGSFTSFPAQDDNELYKSYLEWVAEGNVAEAADE